MFATLNRVAATQHKQNREQQSCDRHLRCLILRMMRVDSKRKEQENGKKTKKIH